MQTQVSSQETWRLGDEVSYPVTSSYPHTAWPELASLLWSKERFIVVARTLLLGLAPYSPECVEGVFSEVRLVPDHYRKGCRHFRPIAR
jgi:hypothetical protein